MKIRYGRDQVERLIVFIGFPDMQVFRGDVHADQVTLVPDIVGIDVQEAAAINLDGQVVMVALVEEGHQSECT